MADFEFLQNKISAKWVISAPRRAHRTNVDKKVEPICPFCPGQEIKEEELYRIEREEEKATKEPSLSGTETNVSGTSNSSVSSGSSVSSNWQVRVISNKFPFASNHEVIVHSPDHHKNFDELPTSQVELILKSYRERYNVHSDGQTYIFHNAGAAAGASLEHPHTQLVVIPAEVKFEIQGLDLAIYNSTERVQSAKFKVQNYNSKLKTSNPKLLTFNFEFLTSLLGRKKRKTTSPENILETEYFFIFCPPTSEWPDEVWIAPKKGGSLFGEISDREITDLSFVLPRIIQIFDSRHGHEFPFNFYIYPGKNWYLRLIPRIKIIGGFELGTNIIVNTQDPTETFAFIKEHFWEPDHEKIKQDYQADYKKSA